MRKNYRQSCFKPVLLSIALLAHSYGAMANSDIAPEAESGIQAIQSAKATEYIAVTANPHATAAANKILSMGGSAVDATIAAQLVLGLVEPQSSGIGGGAFLLHWNSQNKQLLSYDGRETAPAALDENHFLRFGIKPMGFIDAVVGGHAVGTPGVIKLFEQAHKAHGVLPWNTLFEPAIKLAEQGFRVSPRLHKLILWSQKFGTKNTEKAFTQYFFDAKGKVHEVGSLLRNPPYANTLRLIASQGAKGFYEGELAKEIVKAVNSHPQRPGKLSIEDLRNYQSQQRPPLCLALIQHNICSMGPPSSGGFTVLNLLGILEHRSLQPTTSRADFFHTFSQASRLAYADRNTYIADPDFVTVPLPQLLSPEYLKKTCISHRFQKRNDKTGFSRKACPYQPSQRLAAC